MKISLRLNYKNSLQHIHPMERGISILVATTISLFITYMFFNWDISLTSILAFITIVIVICTLAWIVLVRRELFDPRVYVLYGILHWVLVSQAVTLFGYNYLEGGAFSERTHYKGSLSIVTAVVFFLVGYASAPVRLPSYASILSNSLKSINYKFLIVLLIVAGSIGGISLYWYIKNSSDLSYKAYLITPITYLLIPASILAVYVFIVHSPKLGLIERSALRIITGLIIVFTLSTSNVAVIFPLFALFYWYFNRGFPAKTVSRWVVLLMIASYPVIMFAHLFVKELQLPYGEGSPLSFERLLSPDTLENVLVRLMALDFFNIENYSAILYSIELFPDRDIFLWGKTLLVVAAPILYLVFPDITGFRGYGRIIITEVYGTGTYQATSSSWAVPPVGELIANFGYVGIPIYYILLGWICRYLYRSYLKCKSQTFLIMYGIFLPWLLMNQRGDFLNGNMYPAYVAILTYIILRLSKRISRRMPFPQPS